MSTQLPLPTSKLLTNTRGLADRLLAKIGDAVIRGHIKPGDKLPTETELTKLYGVSRGPVREAMKTLVAIGVVEIKRGEGTFVRKHVAPSALNQLIFSLLLQQGGAQELVELRKAVEMGMLGIIVDKAEQKDVQRMEKVIGEMEQILEVGTIDVRRLTEIHSRFHRAFVEAAHNPLITTLWSAVFQMFLPTIEGSLERTKAKRDLVGWLRWHREITQGIKDKDLEKTKKAVRECLWIWERRAFS